MKFINILFFFLANICFAQDTTCTWKFYDGVEYRGFQLERVLTDSRLWQVDAICFNSCGSSIKVASINVKEHLNLLSFIRNYNNFQDMAISGNYLWFNNSSFSRVFDIVDLSNPKLIKMDADRYVGKFSRLSANENVVGIISAKYGVDFYSPNPVDLSDSCILSSLHVGQSYDIFELHQTYPSSISITGSLAYIGIGNGILVLDISGMISSNFTEPPKFVILVKTGIPSNILVASGDRVFVGSGIEPKAKVTEFRFTQIDGIVELKKLWEFKTSYRPYDMDIYDGVLAINENTMGKPAAPGICSFWNINDNSAIPIKMSQVGEESSVYRTIGISSEYGYSYWMDFLKRIDIKTGLVNSDTLLAFDNASFGLKIIPILREINGIKRWVLVSVMDNGTVSIVETD